MEQDAVDQIPTPADVKADRIARKLKRAAQRACNREGIAEAHEVTQFTYRLVFNPATGEHEQRRSSGRHGILGIHITDDDLSQWIGQSMREGDTTLTSALFELRTLRNLRVRYMGAIRGLKLLADPENSPARSFLFAAAEHAVAADQAHSRSVRGGDIVERRTGGEGLSMVADHVAWLLTQRLAESGVEHAGAERNKALDQWVGVSLAPGKVTEVTANIAVQAYNRARKEACDTYMQGGDQAAYERSLRRAAHIRRRLRCAGVELQFDAEGKATAGQWTGGELHDDPHQHVAAAAFQQVPPGDSRWRVSADLVTETHRLRTTGHRLKTTAQVDGLVRLELSSPVNGSIHAFLVDSSKGTVDVDIDDVGRPVVTQGTTIVPTITDPDALRMHHFSEAAIANAVLRRS